MHDTRKELSLNQETVGKKMKNKNESTKPMRRVRIVYNDPYATESSDDEEISEMKVKKVVREVCYTVGNFDAPEIVCSLQESNSAEKSLKKSDSGEKNLKKKRVLAVTKPKQSNTSGKYRGVRQRKWGSFAAEIRHPIMRKRIWLGTFATAEEASEAYEKKKIEFDALVVANSNNSSVKSSNSKTNKDVSACSVSEDSTGSATSLTSQTSPASVLELDSLTSALAINDNNTNYAAALDAKIADEKIADLGPMDLDFELDALMAMENIDGPMDDLFNDDLLSEFDDIPLFGIEDVGQPSALPDFDFDFDFDFKVCNEVLSWMNEEEPAMNGAPPAPLNIACP